MQSLAERIAALPEQQRAEVLSRLEAEEAEALLWDWRNLWARPDQVAPDGDWDVWLLLAGRGFGKTRTAAEWVREEVKAGRATRIALIGETAAEARDVMVEGSSGILAVHPPHERPEYEPSKRRLTWPNGAVATTFNAVEPDQLRGPEFDLAWCDELAKFRYAQETWDMLQFALRIGDHPRVAVTTTPRAIPLVRGLVKRDGGEVVVTRGRTVDNRANMAPSFFKRVLDKYGGTRLGRQELDAEILDDVPGALWTRAMLDEHRVREAPELKRIVVAVDPAITSDETSEEPGENGIVVAGLDQRNHGYLVEDASLVGTPAMWARRAVAMMDLYEADAIVVEINQGGEMVKHCLRSVRPNVKIIEVRASRGKHVRAEPIAAMYEQGRVHHVGAFAELEDQMVLMTPQGFLGETSPDRLDGAVWAFTELFPQMIQTEQPKRTPRKRRTGWAA